MDAKDEQGEISQMLDFIPQLREIFSVEGKVGEGTFSKVYKAHVKSSTNTNKEYALKYLVPTSRPSRIASELQCLKEVGGQNNIVGIELSIMHNGHVVIVMPYFPHQRFVDYIQDLATSDIREYMKNLFIALEEIHAHGIIHRDVKPNNFLCDRHQKKYALVDFGLAQRTHIMEKLSSSLTTKPFKDHNAMYERLHKNEPMRVNPVDGSDKLVPTSKWPSQTIPHSVLPKKRPLSIDQENNITARKVTSHWNNMEGNPVKKLAMDFSPLINNFIPSVSSRPSPILPTPPPTPSSNYSSALISVKRMVNTPDLEPASQKRGNSHQKACQCFGEDVVCKLCLGRTGEEAPRGGTPGFRAPEVLLKCREQSTALDMWSAGVILLSMLSGKYPFFRAEDDLSSLAEITYLVGINEIKDAASALGKHIVINVPGFLEVSKVRRQLTPARYFQAVCTMFRNEDASYSRHQDASLPQKKHNSSLHDLPESVYDLLNRLLDPNPMTRITATEALSHPFICDT